MNNNKNLTIYEHLTNHKNVLVDLAAMIIAVVLLGIMSNIKIPIWPVPITLQTFGVFLIAFVFGKRMGAITLLMYLLAGIVGFNVFSGGKSGIESVMGPTGGYIFGFILCTIIVGHLIEKGYGRTKKSVIGCLIAGNAVIYICGLIGLNIYLAKSNPVSFWKLLNMGLIPFLVGDMLKIIAATYTFPKLWKN